MLQASRYEARSRAISGSKIGVECLNLLLREEIAKLGAAPENVFGRVCPLLLNQVIDLALTESLPEILTQIGHAAGAANYFVTLGSVGAKPTLEEARIQPGVFGG